MNRKSALGVMVMEGMAMAPKCLCLSYTAVNITLLPVSPYASLLIPTLYNFSW